MNSAFSRRKAEELIKEKRITLNGEIVERFGVLVNPEKDIVKIDNKIIKNVEEFIYILLNKPAGYITTRDDTHNRKTVMNLIPYKNVVPVGRLDKETEGLLILTNDGDLTYKLTHPKFEHEKEYFVLTKHPFTREELLRLEEGVIIDGKKTSKCKFTDISEKRCCITIHEGRKRQIRRMFEEIGNAVIYLKRIRIGNLKLGSLEKGKFRKLTANDLKQLI